jgi:RNA polymerase sigma-70 factor (ECF subfamily)
MVAWVFGARRKRATPEGLAGNPSTLSRFEQQVLPHLDAAYTLAVYLCRDRDAAEDVVQDAFLRAFRGFAGFRGDNARAWLLTIVRNCHLSWRDELRRRSSVMSGSADGQGGDEVAHGHEIPADDPDPETMLVNAGEADAVRAVLDGMADEAREILVLRDVEDLSYREIADVLDVPLGTVMSRISRARKAFAARWRSSMAAGEQP